MLSDATDTLDNQLVEPILFHPEQKEIKEDLAVIETNHMPSAASISE